MAATPAATITQRNAQSERRYWQLCWPLEGSREVGRRFAIRDWMWCGQVKGTVEVLVVDEESKGSDLIGDRNERPILFALTQPAADAELEELDHSLPGAAFTADD